MQLEKIEIEMLQWIAETKRTRQSALNLALSFSQLLQEMKLELSTAESAADEQWLLLQMSHVERRLSDLRLDVEQLSGGINHGQQWLEKIEAGDKAGAMSDVEAMKRIAIEFYERGQ